MSGQQAHAAFRIEFERTSRHVQRVLHQVIGELAEQGYRLHAALVERTAWHNENELSVHITEHTELVATISRVHALRFVHTPLVRVTFGRSAELLREPFVHEHVCDRWPRAPHPFDRALDDHVVVTVLGAAGRLRTQDGQSLRDVLRHAFACHEDDIRRWCSGLVVVHDH